jgi:four helix bundle protein
MPHKGEGHSFERLRVWQEATQLAREVFRIVRHLPRDYREVAEQMRDASRSVYANIAEGSGCPSTRDFLRFLGYSRKSLRELESDVIALRRSRTLSPAVGVALANRIGHVERLLEGFIRKLSSDL